MALPGTALSQGATPVELPPVQVDGDQVGQSVKTAYEVRHASPNAKVVIESEQLNQFNDMSIGDAIRRLPGVTFPGVNRSREIKLRGLPGVYTRVLLDGRPLIDGDSGRNMEVDRIPASFIERVEIIRNPLASSDSQGAAGTVNIITKRNFGAGGGGATLGIGHVQNFKTNGEGSIWQGGQTGKLKYFVGAGYQRRLLEESENTFNTVGASASEGKVLQKQLRAFDEYTALGRFEFMPDDSNSFIVAPTYLRTEELRDQQDDRYQRSPPIYMNRSTSETRNRVRENIGSYFEWAHNFTNTTSTRLFFDIQKSLEATTRNSMRYDFNAAGARTGTTPGNSYVPIDLMRYAPGVAFTSLLGEHTVEAGAGLNRLTRREFDAANAYRDYKIGENIFYGYVSDSLPIFGNDRLTIGGRLEHSVTSTTNAAGLESSRDATDFNPSVNYRATIMPDVDFRAGIAKTLRRPDLRDLSPTVRNRGGTVIDPHTRGNPDLAPERIWGADTGVDWFLFDRTGLLSANLFVRHFDNKIESITALEGIGYVATTRNSGSGHMYGAELEARIPLSFVPNLTLWGNATILRSELTDPLTRQTRRFAEQPDLLTNIGLDYYVPEWKTTFGLNFNRTFSYSQNIASLTGGTPAAPLLTYTDTSFNALNKLDLSIRMQLAPNVTLSFAALNLLRPTDRRVVNTFDPTGTLTKQVISEQASHSTYYVRTTFTW